MNILFLDYDGVVNTPMWNDEGTQCRFNFPEDGQVNNFQAVQWVSEFCEKYGYAIVVSSTWRTSKNYITCLKNGGLRNSVKVLGKTPSLKNAGRGAEIQAYLNEHPSVEKYIIIDDDDFDLQDMTDHLVLCNSNIGFGLLEFQKAVETNARMERESRRCSNG